MITPMHDMDRINQLMKHDLIWPHISCDRCTKDDFQAPDGIYLGAFDDDVNAGFFLVQPVNSVTAEIHTVIDPVFWGRAELFAKEVISWIFSETSIMKIITFIPEYNIKAKRLAEKAGMTNEGLVRSSYLKGGVLHDQFLYGIGK